ncbi:MAG: zf-HC2 domain-containing protein [Candidatus Aminicenantes bacterium]|nr:zf-HC2 domain-containing protein [Candidatus Aminicenantes bacterium]MDH5466507.1 zf-HC2 domain-containing protein [Candidatus Aminicenantes bacterium]MDH5704398.1 zf-HC2 domain-containing protein [Candidatus Aminicenantes bacterium]
MDHQKIKELISSYHDGELDEAQKKRVERHLEECPECRKEFEEMGKFEEVMSQMELKKPQKEAWQMYWTSVYNRLERGIGWILFSIGAIILLFFGGYKLVEGIIQDASTPLILKIGILSILGGLVVLLVSLLREQLFVRRRERYKEIEK